MSHPILVVTTPDGEAGARAFADAVARRTGAPLAEVDAPEHGRSARAVADAIEAQQPALVVLTAGSHAVDHAIRSAECPVAVVPRGHTASSVRTVGAAFTPTPEGRAALRAAAALAGALGARLRGVEALDPKHMEEGAESLMARQHHEHDAAEDTATRHTMDAEAALQSAIAELPGDVAAETDFLFQDPAQALVAASGNLDLLVMGSRARGRFKSVVLGSVSSHVTGSAHCPVIVLPRGTEGDVEALLAGGGASEEA